METVFDFSFLSSPVDPRLDKQIGQHFVLSYLNSEPHSSYSFRYRPYEEMGGLVTEYTKLAVYNDNYIGDVEVRQAYTERSMRNKEAIDLERKKFSAKDRYSAVINQNFSATLKEISTLVLTAMEIAETIVVSNTVDEVIFSDARIQLKDSIVAGEGTAFNRNDASADTIVNQYITSIRNKLETIENVNYADYETFASEQKKDAIVSIAYDIFSLFTPKPEALVIGEWMLSQIKELRQATSYDDIKWLSRSPKTMHLVEYYDSRSLTLDQLDSYRYPEMTIYERFIDEVSIITLDIAHPINHVETIVQELRSGIVTDAEAIQTDVRYGDTTDNEVTIEHVYVLEKSLTKHQGIELDITEMDSFTKEAKIRDVELFDSQDKNESVIIQLQTTDKLQVKEVSMTEYSVFNKIDNAGTYVMELQSIDDFERTAIDSSGLRTVENHIDFYTSEVYDLTAFDSNRNKDVRIEEWWVGTQNMPNDAYTEQQYTYVDRMEKDSRINTERIYTMKNAIAARVDDNETLTTSISYDSVRFDIPMSVNRLKYEGNSDDETVLIDRIKYEGHDLELTLFNRWTYNGLVSNEYDLLSDKIQTVSHIEEYQLFDKSPHITRINDVDVMTTKILGNSEKLDDMIEHMSKIAVESVFIDMVTKMDRLEKVSLIRDNIDKFTKSGRLFDEYSEIKFEDRAEKEAKASEEFEQPYYSDNNAMEARIDELLSDGSDIIQINSMILELVGANRNQFFNEALEQALENALRKDKTGEGQRVELVISNPIAKESDAYKQEHEIAGHHLDKEGVAISQEMGTRSEAKAILQGLIETFDAYQKQREGIITPDMFVLANDESDWEDIWKRYSPGIDILDPPDSDYDYSKLASIVYNEENGMPLNPIGRTNQADVIVPIPLHHPLPEHFDLGVDDTREMPVDNYIFIDVVLAIESLKNRNKLRYAGMPAEKTVRELFSNLFTWIQQAAPNNPEYDRMFRFARWYAESVVIKLSKHILHRVYDSWKTKFHLFEDLDIAYDATGWKYYPSSAALQTTDIHGEYKFKMENYIDGELILRGYFDNPLNEGTMKIVVDGKILLTLNTKGSFIRTIPIPQGKHTYEFIFDGTSGRVSLSTFEISGCKFISAHTSSDDSDTNGLKASMNLVNNLLAYFDKHHGGGKTKGTMEVKQRRVWNVQT